MNCPQCNEKLTKTDDYEMSTMVGYFSNCPLGNTHDDNCLTRSYSCVNEHVLTLSKHRSCECGWKGKETCFCHEGKKLEEWPE